MAGESFPVNGFLGTYAYYYLRPRGAKVWVNGIDSPVKNGYIPFTTQFDKTGPQSLAIRVEMREDQRDTLRVFEKTYTVNVK